MKGERKMSKTTNNIQQEWQLFFEWCKANDRSAKDGNALLDYMAQLRNDKK